MALLNKDGPLPQKNGLLLFQDQCLFLLWQWRQLVKINLLINMTPTI